MSTTFDPELIGEVTQKWAPESRQAMLQYLSDAHAREAIKARYATVADLAKAIDPTFVVTPALEMIAQRIEVCLQRPRRNLLITMPPQEGKSTICAVYTPLRALQLNPNRRIILATYAANLALDHSRECRDLISRHGSGVIDPMTGVAIEDKLGFRISPTAAKAEGWRIAGSRGGMVATGLDGSITGRAADLFIIDDPYKNMQEADSATQRAKVNEWMQSVARTRLSPSASMILIQCMTGDTPVLLPDGTEKRLDEVRPGDEIATYDAGVLGTSMVRNWASQGYDSIYEITMESGRTVRANARHPFLVVDDDGVESWVKLAHLQPGDRLMAIADTTGSAARNAIGPRTAKDCASPTTTKCDGPTATSRSQRNSGETGTCGTAMVSAWPTTTACSLSRAVSAVRVGKNLAHTIARRIGRVFSASTTAMKRASCEGCSATIATSSSGGPEQRHGCARVPTISTDTVNAIEFVGTAEVFDIEVERTENFIANGLVSHNTRWHPEDLAGQIIERERELDPRWRTWHHINIPAIAEEGLPDALGREYGEAMVSARGRTPFDFEATRADVGERVWYALYQGSPRNPAGGLFMRKWFEDRLDAAPERPVAAVVGIDPADSGHGDETGIIGAVLAEDGTIVLAEDWSARFTADEWSRQAVWLALRLNAREIALEAYSAADTYVAVVKRAWKDIHREVIEKRADGGRLTDVEERALTPQMPFMIRKWRAAGTGDPVGRSSLLRQACETGKCRVVENKLAVFVDQAADWQAGQHQPDRVSAAIVAHDRLAALGSGRMTLVPPLGTGGQPPAWLRRRIG